MSKLIYVCIKCKSEGTDSFKIVEVIPDVLVNKDGRVVKGLMEKAICKNCSQHNVFIKSKPIPILELFKQSKLNMI